MREGHWVLITLIGVVLWTIIGGVNYYLKNYHIAQDTDAYINRAQVAANATDMLEYMQKAKDGIEKHRLTEGHWTVIFKKPDNDFALNYRSINRIIERLDEVKNLPQDTVAYQTALDDIRGTIRELPNPAHGATWVKYGFFYAWFTLGLWLIWLIWGFIWLIKNA